MSIVNDRQKYVSWLNTVLLAVVIFFLGRLVNQFDNVAENVHSINRDVAIVKNTVDRHEKEIESIKSSSKIYTSEKRNN